MLGVRPHGQLGDRTHISPTEIDVPAPVDVLSVSGATQVSAGAANSCATLANGTAVCWERRSSEMAWD